MFLHQANASPILQIGDLSSPVKSIQSCSVFAGERTNARCICCLLTSNQDGYFIDRDLTHLCATQGDCSDAVITNLMEQTRTNDPLALIQKLKEKHLQNQNISVSPSSLIGGVFSSNGLKDFLTSTAQKNGFKNPDTNAYLQDTKCVDVKSLGDGGKQTLQIFLVSGLKNCGMGFHREQPRLWILKETKQFLEVRNLQTLMASPVIAFDIKKTNRNLRFPAVAFPTESFTYVDGARNPHYMLLMDAAPGIPFAKIIQSKDLEKLSQASYLIGEKLVALHKEFMKPDGKKLLGSTIVHGDLHSNNIFVDQPSKTVTLIDVETFVKSFNTPSTPAVDLFMLYGFATSHLQTSQRVAHDLTTKEWHQYFLKPFLQGYVSNWPERYQITVLKELKDMFNSPFTIRKIFKNRFLAISYPKFLYDVKRYANPIFAELMR